MGRQTLHWTQSLIAVSCAVMLAACGGGDKGEAIDTPAPVDSSAAAPAGVPDNMPVGRLFGDASPVAYRVAMTVDPRLDAFAGTSTIDIELSKAADGIWLHGDDLDVSRVMITSGADTFEGTWTEALPTGVVWIGSPRELPAGQVTVAIDYTGAFDPLLAGLFKVEEQGNAYALAKSESIQARRFLPSFDEPGFKAPFTFELTVPKGDKVITNTPEVSRMDAGGGMETVTFAPTRPLSTYLLSLAVGPFDLVERPDIPPNEYRSTPIPLRGYARAGRGGDMNLIMDATPEMMAVFERGLKQPYPYKKLDIVAAPAWPSGATELAGAITYRESRILIGDDPTPAARRSMMDVHAHEIAHMWFGNLVTPPWWDDLWLKEAFASWGTPFALVEMEPGEGYDVDAVIDSLSAMRLDSLAAARRVNEPIERNEDIRNAYDAITYRKGLAVISMVDNYFGAENFRPALGEYIAAFEDGAADSDDFYKVIGDVSGEPELTKVFRSFVDQQGLPFVKVELACNANPNAPAMLEVTQSRYRPLGSAIKQGTRWSIPMCVSYGDGRDMQKACAIISETSDTIELEGDACPSVIMPNSGGTGYYRWGLSTERWKTLADVFGELPEAEALSVIDSATAAFEAGEADAAATLAILEAAANSPYRRVATAPMGALGRYAYMVEGKLSEDSVADYMRGVYAQRLAGITGLDNPQDAELRRRIENFLAISGNQDDIRQRLASKAETYIGANGVPDEVALLSDQYFTGLSVALDMRGEEFFRQLLNARARIDNPQFAMASASAIGSVDEPALTDSILELALSADVEPREAYSIINGQMNNAATRGAATQWLDANFEAVVNKIPRQWGRRMPTLASGLCDAGDVQTVEALFTRHADLIPGYERALSQTVERIKLCAAGRDQLGDDMVAAMLARL